MQLFYSSTSPFVRKVLVLAHETGLQGELERVKTNPWQGEAVLTAENPLSKIPTLVTNSGQVLYDSRVICEYLDGLHEGVRMIPEAGEQRWQVLRLQALADGILDAGILRFMEAKREVAQRSPEWDKMQKNAVERGLDYLQTNLSNWNTEINLGVITVACLLGWLDFRFSHEPWRTDRPGLADWYDTFSQRPSMQATVPFE